MEKCKCLRCGYTWYPRYKWVSEPFTVGAETMSARQRRPVPSKRCASCRSPYWNRMYVRENKNRAPGSIGYQPPLPLAIEAGKALTAHAAGIVSSKKVSSSASVANPKRMSRKGALVARAKKTLVGCRASRKALTQHGKTSTQK